MDQKESVGSMKGIKVCNHGLLHPAAECAYCAMEIKDGRIDALETENAELKDKGLKLLIAWTAADNERTALWGEVGRLKWFREHFGDLRVDMRVTTTAGDRAKTYYWLGRIENQYLSVDEAIDAGYARDTTPGPEPEPQASECTYNPFFYDCRRNQCAGCPSREEEFEDDYLEEPEPGGGEGKDD